jgi:hypothetical protein
VIWGDAGPTHQNLVALSCRSVTHRTARLLHLPDVETNGIFDALQGLKYSNAVEVIDEVLTFNPAATVADVRQYASIKRKSAEIQLEEAEARIERAVCRHCGIEIVRGNDGAWYHGDIPSWGSRGCRSYSFHRLGTWDDTLDRRWTATPT